MSKLTEQLKTIGIFNPHNLVNTGHPFIWRRAREPQACVTPAWLLTVNGRAFKGVPWYDHGNLSFSNFGTQYATLREAVVLPLAKCKDLFPDLEMVKGPWPNTYVPKVDLDAAMEKLKEQGK